MSSKNETNFHQKYKFILGDLVYTNFYLFVNLLLIHKLRFFDDTRFSFEPIHSRATSDIN